VMGRRNGGDEVKIHSLRHSIKPHKRLNKYEKLVVRHYKFSTHPPETWLVRVVRRQCRIYNIAPEGNAPVTQLTSDAGQAM
jgi:hypothetical protein